MKREIDTHNPEEVASAVSDLLNGLGDEARKRFVAAVMQDHRTLQQSMFRTIVDLMRGWAEAHKRGRFDPRNEATCKASALIIDTMGDDLHVPMI